MPQNIPPEQITAFNKFASDMITRYKIFVDQKPYTPEGGKARKNEEAMEHVVAMLSKISKGEKLDNYDAMQFSKDANDGFDIVKELMEYKDRWGGPRETGNSAYDAYKALTKMCNDKLIGASQSHSLPDSRIGESCAPACRAEIAISQNFHKLRDCFKKKLVIARIA